jgi:hypothetical protein
MRAENCSPADDEDPQTRIFFYAASSGTDPHGQLRFRLIQPRDCKDFIKMKKIVALYEYILYIIGVESEVPLPTFKKRRLI